MTGKRVRTGFQLYSLEPVQSDGTAHLALRSERYFKPTELIVGPLVAKYFWLMEMKMGAEPVKFWRDKAKDFQLKGGRICISQAGDVPPALSMTFVLVNRLSSPCFFYGEVWGDLEQALPRRGTPCASNARQAIPEGNRRE